MVVRLYEDKLADDDCHYLETQDKKRQDKTFIIIILQVQFFGTQLAKKR